MGKVSDSFLDTAVYRRALSRWADAAREAHAAPLSILRRQSLRAKELRAHLDRLIHKADERLARPAVGSTSFPKPHNADWAWRPEAWCGSLPVLGQSSVKASSPLSNEVALFHDCPRCEISYRQLRNHLPDDLAPFGIRLDVFNFDGSFLSLVLDLPEAAIDGLNKSHVFRVSTITEMEKPLQVFARLNIEHGPNTEQTVRTFAESGNEASVEFDLAYADFNENRINKAWVDVIFENPRMNQITLRDLTFSRRPRAQL